MAEDSGSPDYYPLRWKIADAAEDLFVLHRGRLAALVLLLVAGLAVGWLLFFGDDDSEVQTTQPSDSVVDDNGGDGNGSDGSPSTTAGPAAPDDSASPDSTHGSNIDDPSTTAPSSTDTTTSTTSTTTSTTTTTTTTLPPVDQAIIDATEPGAIMELGLDSINLVGGLPTPDLASANKNLATTIFPDITIIDDQVVAAVDKFPTPNSVLFRLGPEDLFGYNRDSVNDRYLPLLDSIAAYLIDEGAAVEVGGHTDATGPAAGNQRLSERRAQAAANYLVSKGVDSAQVSAVGYGEDRPIPGTNGVDPANRRLEFIVS